MAFGKANAAVETIGPQCVSADPWRSGPKAMYSRLSHSTQVRDTIFPDVRTRLGATDRASLAELLAAFAQARAGDVKPDPVKERARIEE